MTIDDSESGNLVIPNDDNGSANTSARTVGSSGQRRNPDSTYTPEPDVEKDDLEDN
jgi:hypothetical protein